MQGLPECSTTLKINQQLKMSSQGNSSQDFRKFGETDLHGLEMTLIQTGYLFKRTTNTKPRRELCAKKDCLNKLVSGLRLGAEHNPTQHGLINTLGTKRK